MAKKNALNPKPQTVPIASDAGTSALEETLRSVDYSDSTNLWVQVGFCKRGLGLGFDYNDSSNLWVQVGFKFVVFCNGSFTSARRKTSKCRPIGYSWAPL